MHLADFPSGVADKHQASLGNETDKSQPAMTTIIAFDLYGTILSTDSIAAELTEIAGHDRAGELASLWRRYQLEYTWRINSMGE